MGRQPCCDKVGLKKGPWTVEEDKKLINFILNNGQCCWRAVPKLAGLLRCGKSCRLRWTNYLRPDLKRGLLSDYEEKMVIDLHAQLGNKWSKIASHLPGRTDNEIKNHWNTHIKKKLKKMGIDPVTHKSLIIPNTIQPQEQQEEDQETSLSTTAISQRNREVEAKAEESSVQQLVVNNGFCIDEVPLIDEFETQHDILLPNCELSSSNSTISSSSSSSFCSPSSNCTDSLEEMPPFLQNLESWMQCDDFVINDLGIWDDDFTNFDLLNMSADNDVSNLTVEPAPLIHHSPFQ